MRAARLVRGRGTTVVSQEIWIFVPIVSQEALPSVIPVHTHVETNKRTHDKEDHAKVPSPDVEGGDHDDAANQRKENGHYDVVAVLQLSTRRPRDGQGDKEGDDRRGCLNEICGIVVEAKRSDNLEIAISISRPKRMPCLQLTEGKKSLYDWAMIKEK